MFRPTGSAARRPRGRLLVAGALVLAAGIAAPPAAASPRAQVPTATQAPAPLPGGTWVPLPQRRIVDTRVGLGAPRGPVRSVTVTADQAGVPSTGVQAVVVNATVVAPAAAGYLSRIAGWAPTDLSYSAHTTVAGMVTLPVGFDGSLRLTASSATELVLDVMGYFTTATAAGTSGLYDAVAPTRLVDTRVTHHRLCGGCSLGVPVAGHGGVPASGATSAVVDITGVAPTASGYLTVYPGGGTEPGTSTLNIARGQTVANRAIVPIGSDGTLRIASSSATDVLVDVTGYFTGEGGQGAYFSGDRQARLVDTRGSFAPSGRQTGAVTLPVAADNFRYNQGYEFDVTVPSVRAVTRPVAVLATLTSTAGTRGGSATLGASGAAKPPTSDLNFPTGATVTNAALPTLGADGNLTLYSAATSHYLLDVVGYFALPAATPPQGAWGWGNLLSRTLYPPEPRATYTSTPTAVSDDSHVASMVSDGADRYVLHTDGTLDRVSTVPPALVPTVTTLLTDVTAVTPLLNAIGGFALRTDGTVWSWGTNHALGVAGVTDRPDPEPIPGISDAVAVAGGNEQGYAVLADGTVLDWGDNLTGELGDGTTTASPTPHAIPGLDDIATVAASTGRTAIAVHRDGSVSFWGAAGGNATRLSPAISQPQTPCTATSAFAAAQPWVRCADGTARPVSGPANVANTSVPTDVVEVALDPDQGLAPLVLRTDGTVWRAVDNAFQPVPGLAGIAGISGTRNTALAWTS